MNRENQRIIEERQLQTKCDYFRELENTAQKFSVPACDLYKVVFRLRGKKDACKSCSFNPEPPKPVEV